MWICRNLRLASTLVGAVVMIVASASLAEAFYGAGYRYCRRLTIDGSMVSGGAPHADFPVLIALSDPELRTVGNGGHVESASGFDIIFVDSTETTQLDHEIAAYDAATGAIEMWVRIPLLSPGVDADVLLYYGNPGIVTSLENVPGVWQNGYEAVWHLDGDFDDSSGNGRHGTNSGSVDVTGIAGRGRDFTPVSSIDAGVWDVPGSTISLQGWASFDDFDQDDPRIVSKALTGDPQDHVFMLSLGGSGNQYLRGRVKTGTNDATGTTTLIDNTTPLGTGSWTFCVATYDGADMRLFIDGAEVRSTGKTGSIRENGWAVTIGNNPTGTSGWGSLDGQLDEVRVSSVVRSPSWQLTERANVLNQGVGPGSFISSMSTELACVGLELVKRAYLPDGTPVSDGETVASGTLVKYLIYINNRGGDQADVSVRDVLDGAFVYQGGTIRVANPSGACAADTCDAAEEAAILAAVDATPALTDQTGDDVASITGVTIDVGDEQAANARLDIVVDSVLAVSFVVKID